MDPRVSFITLAVADLAATRRFYVDGLGWEPTFEQEGEVLMFEVAEKVVLSLWAVAGPALQNVFDTAISRVLTGI